MYWTLPNSNIFEEDIQRDEQGLIITDQNMAASIGGYLWPVMWGQSSFIRLPLRWEMKLRLPLPQRS